MINHHWLRIRESRTQIFNCGVSTCLHYRIYVRKCQEKFFPPLKLCCRPIPMPFLPRSSTAALPCSYPRKVVSHFLAGMNLSSCIASHHNPRIWKTKKHRKTLTTQAGFLLSEDQPLTVLGSSMMLHHCLRLRDLSMGIISLWLFSLSEL